MEKVSIKAHLPSTENHSSHCMPQSLARASPAAWLGCQHGHGNERLGGHGEEGGLEHTGAKAELPPPTATSWDVWDLNYYLFFLFFKPASCKTIN